MVTYWIGLGGNEKTTRVAFEHAIAKLNSSAVQVEEVSTLYRTAPISEAPATIDSPAYWNAASRVETDLSAKSLLDLCQQLEADAGRQSTDDRWTSRPLDLDILAGVDKSGQAIEIATEHLTVPHPLAAYRRFVLDPLNDLAPNPIRLQGASIAQWRARWCRRPLPISGTEHPWPQTCPAFGSEAASLDPAGVLNLSPNELPIAAMPFDGFDAERAAVGSVMDQPKPVATFDGECGRFVDLSDHVRPTR